MKSYIVLQVLCFGLHASTVLYIISVETLDLARSRNNLDLESSSSNLRPIEI